MYKITQIRNWVKIQWCQNGTVALACAFGFAMGWTIAMQIPLRASLNSPHTATPVYRAASSSARIRHLAAPAMRSSAPAFPVRGPLQGATASPLPRPTTTATSSSSIPSSASQTPPDQVVDQRHSSSSSFSSFSESSSSKEAVDPASHFPPFTHAVYPVSHVPNWGAMHAAAQWNRSYAELTRDDFVPLPAYDSEKLIIPFTELLSPRNDAEITRKLFYSTHYFGAYDVDAGEFTAAHPGVDLKLAAGTPIGSIAGGRAHRVLNSGALGLHVIIEHRIGDEVYYSIYGHLGFVSVKEGDDVTGGQFIGTVGMTGNTSAPHLHLQIDRGHGELVHEPYAPKTVPAPGEAEKWVVHPIRFIEQH